MYAQQSVAIFVASVLVTQPGNPDKSKSKIWTSASSFVAGVIIYSASVVDEFIYNMYFRTIFHW